MERRHRPGPRTAGWQVRGHRPQERADQREGLGVKGRGVLRPVARLCRSPDRVRCHCHGELGALPARRRHGEGGREAEWVGEEMTRGRCTIGHSGYSSLQSKSIAAGTGDMVGLLPAQGAKSRAAFQSLHEPFLPSLCFHLSSLIQSLDSREACYGIQSS